MLKPKQMTLRKNRLNSAYDRVLGQGMFSGSLSMRSIAAWRLFFALDLAFESSW
ncbi:hypothetical protein OE88DRAFT_202075 [Heliocybe sulcata]|uniref:Uncharacterized protein n=1 Tax=Heliocybe sulcata TaxID=5364 RepID=A0A5C3N1C5_9AGAM|nr:hypothetical protein OE88DRAFT_202075 [Heliocybe sulcata]